MQKSVGVLYDNISQNTGDLAIGLSLVKMLTDMGIGFNVLAPGRFDPGDYETIIVGGGHILRPGPDAFYDNFRVPGGHILNAAGILGRPNDLQYLEDYRYVTVRSDAEKKKLSYLKNKVHVVPCTSMLLEDLTDIPVQVKRPALGIHLLPGMMGAREEKAFIRWASSLPFTIYFIPITHYIRDHLYMQRLSAGIRNSIVLPRLEPLEIFTLMGRIDMLISSSLHGAVFAYAHNTPFILLDYDEKMSSFMGDRRLQAYLFRGFAEMKDAFRRLCEVQPDHSASLARDRQTLMAHVDRLEELLPRGGEQMRPGQYMKNIPQYPVPFAVPSYQPGRRLALAMRLGAIGRSIDRRLRRIMPGLP